MKLSSRWVAYTLVRAWGGLDGTASTATVVVGPPSRILESTGRLGETGLPEDADLISGTAPAAAAQVFPSLDFDQSQCFDTAWTVERLDLVF